jgi:hypothetical protein
MSKNAEQCVMRPSRLGRHLSQNHGNLIKKPVEFFSTKRDSLKHIKLDNTGTFLEESAKAVKASCEIALLISKGEKLHTTGETLVKPCSLSAAKILLGEEIEKKFQKISLPDSTVRPRIDELAEDIKLQVLEKIKSLPFLLSVVMNRQMKEIVFNNLSNARYVANDSVEEEMLFS